MTVRIEYPPGDPGIPPHRHPGGPCFGYILEGEMVFELEGEPPRVVKAGDVFWEPGGDVIHCLSCMCGSSGRPGYPIVGAAGQIRESRGERPRSLGRAFRSKPAGHRRLPVRGVRDTGRRG
jgi:Cupin domain